MDLSCLLIADCSDIGTSVSLSHKNQSVIEAMVTVASVARLSSLDSVRAGSLPSAR